MCLKIDCVTGQQHEYQRPSRINALHRWIQCRKDTAFHHVSLPGVRMRTKNGSLHADGCMIVKSNLGQRWKSWINFGSGHAIMPIHHASAQIRFGLCTDFFNCCFSPPRARILKTKSAFDGPRAYTILCYIIKASRWLPNVLTGAVVILTCQCFLMWWKLIHSCLLVQRSIHICNRTFSARWKRD